MRRIIGLVLSVGLVTGCSQGIPVSQGNDGGQARQAPAVVSDVVQGLDQFGDCDEVLSFLQINALDQVTAWGLGGWFGPMVDDALRGSVTTAAAMAEADGGSGYSTTNVQELGVDEADIVKTDGKVLVALSYDKLYVADVTGVPRLLGSISLGDMTPQNLFLAGDRAFVIGSSWQTLAKDDDARLGIAAMCSGCHPTWPWSKSMSPIRPSLTK